MLSKISEIFSGGRAHFMEYVSLIFTLFYFFPLLVVEAIEPIWLVKLIVVYVMLVSLLLICVYSNKIFIVVSSAIVIVLAASLGIHFYMGCNVFYCYAIFYITLHLPISRALWGVGFVLASMVSTAYLADLLNVYFFAPTLLPCLFLFVLAIFERRDMAFRKREALSREQIEKLATIAERERIARDMHDVLGHTLSSISLKSQLAGKLCQNQDFDQACKEITEVSVIASEALSEVRQAISGYQILTIHQRLEKLQERLSEKNVAVTIDCDFSSLRPKAEAALALVLTEAVTNILRHSNCSRVDIVTRRQNNCFCLSLCDNGTRENIVFGNGLKGIRERVEALGGNLRVQSEKGFCLFVELGDGNLQ